MKNRVLAWILELPAILILLAAFVASIYVKVSKTYNLGWSVAVIFFVVLVLFFWGKYLENKD